MSIVCSGSVAYDYLMRFPGYFKEHILPEHLEKVSLSFLVEDMIRLQGGIAPNICYALALLGERPYIFSTVGIDFEPYRCWLEAQDIDCTFARIIPNKYTASFFCNTDLCNAQIASFYSGAMSHSADLQLAELCALNVDLFIIAPCDPDAMISYAKQCRELNIPFAFDPSQQLVRMNKEMMLDGLIGAKFLFTNEYELELLKKHTELCEKELFSHVWCAITTLGAKGSRICVDGQEIFAPSFPTEQIIDPTGVGDAFRGGFLVGYKHGFDWETCGKMGALSAAYVLEQTGTQAYSFTLSEYIHRYRTVWDDNGLLDQLH